MQKRLTVVLYFTPELVERPYIYDMAKRYDIAFSILAANIEPGRRGRTTLQLEGEEQEITSAINYLKNQGVRVRMFTDEILHDKSKCVDCGTCTAVCPSGALYLSKESRLQYDSEKCVACEHCIKACPVRAIGHEVFG